MSDEQDWPGQEWPGEEQSSPSQAASSDQEWPGQEWPGEEQHEEAPAPEGYAGTAARGVARGVIPAVGALIGAGAGATVGALAGPVGAVGGGLGGAYYGAKAGEVVNDAIRHAVGFDDDAQWAADVAENPKTAFVSELAPALATMSPVRGAQVGLRALGGGIMGGLEAGQEMYQQGTFDPSRVAIATAAGALLPKANRVGDAIASIGSKPAKLAIEEIKARAAKGRETSTNTAAEDADAIDVSQSELADYANAEGTGNPQSAPENSRGEIATGKADDTYAKGKAPANAAPTPQQDFAPDVAMAARRTAGEDVDRVKQVGDLSNNAVTQPDQSELENQGRARIQRPLGMPAQNFKMPEPSVEAGFPKPGEPVAVGANDATKLPEGQAERFEQAKAPVTTTVSEAPRFKGETPINASITDAQAKAGNYPKARANDFGKPMRVETHEGDIRRSRDPNNPWEAKSPYEYGYYGKTKSTDGEGIDFAEPKVGSPDRGDKHFIIDQRDAETGKYDEPKIFQYYKDKKTAIEAYNRGFSDNKGPERLHDITEVTRPELVKYLVKHTNKPPTKPYGEPMPKAQKPMAERAVVQDAVAKLRAAGKTEEADKLLAAPEDKLAAAIEGKRTRKYGVPSATGKSANYPIEGLPGSTANTKPLAEARARGHKAVKDWFDESKPPSQMDLSKETNGETLDRIKMAKEAASPEGWTRGPKSNPKEWLLQNEAKQLLAKPTKKQFEKFREAERLLRGSDEDVQNYKSTRNIEGTIANTRRSGDEAIANAEAKQAHTGVNDEEAKMLENIGRKRGDFDVPHEEAEEMVKPRPITKAADLKDRPAKTVDVRESKLAEAPKIVKQKPVAKMSLKELTEQPKVEPKKEEPFEKAEAKEGKSVKDKFSAEDMKRMVELSNKTAGRKGRTDEEIKAMDILRSFGKDESGALGGKANWMRGAGARSWIAKQLELSHVDSFRAKTLRTPTEKYINKEEENLHLLDNMNTLHLQENKQRAIRLERDADRAALERIYKAREADSAHIDLPGKQPGKTNIESLGPKDLKIWKDHLEPLAKETEEFKNAIRAMDPNSIGPDVEHYIARITKGNTPEYNMLRRETDPTGPQYYGLGVNAGMAKERAFYALERNADGKRFVIMPNKQGFTLWENQKGTRLKDPNFEFEANQPYTVKGKKGKVDYTMRQATADEIEKSGARFDLGNGKTQPAKYYQNAGLSMLLAHARLGEMLRNKMEMARLLSTKEFQDRMTRNAADADEKGYIKTQHPNFQGYYMDPRIAHLLDQASKPGFDTPEALRRINQQITGLLFWMPVPHIANVGTHWFMGRGFDWVNPAGWGRLAATMPRAIKSVINQDITQRRYMENNAGLIYPSVDTRNFIKQTAEHVGEEMLRDPSGWGPVVDKLGVTAEQLHDWIYGNSAKIMWMANDMFLTQRYMELEAKGLSTEQAIKQAERDIPNYRIPSQLFSGKKSGKGAEFGYLMTRVFGDNAISSFGRYHVGMFNAYANAFKGLLSKDATVGDRIDAAGKFFALGVLAFAVYPVLDKFAQTVTGDEKASQQRRGPLAIPSHLVRAAQGKDDIASAARSTLTIPPFWTTLLEAYNNTDWRKKDIVEPGDVHAAFNSELPASERAYRGGKALVQEGEHWARGLISPLGTLTTAEKKADEPGALGTAKSVGRTLLNQTLDQKQPSLKAQQYEQKQDIINERNARLRERRGGYGMGEEGWIKLHRFLTQ